MITPKPATHLRVGVVSTGERAAGFVEGHDSIDIEVFHRATDERFRYRFAAQAHADGLRLSLREVFSNGSTKLLHRIEHEDTPRGLAWEELRARFESGALELAV